METPGVLSPWGVVSVACDIRLAAEIHLSVGDDVFYSFGAMSTLSHKQLVIP